MMAKHTQTIQPLPEKLVKLIAAGEVVQRPSSVCKELLENALDAGARNIDILIEDGGKTLIQVIDDGFGMNEQDALLSIERHTTSKIRRRDDLLRIASYGFRGEALNAIACVAEVELCTRTRKQPVGTRLLIEEGKVTVHEPFVMPVGTQITVRYLFRNMPGRRNFLKSNALESKHVLDAFQHAALSRPDVAFSFHHNKTKLHTLPATRLSHRIVHLFGKAYEKQLIRCYEETTEASLYGYTGTPKQSRKTRGGQFFFANKRFIKSNYLHHAVKKAYENLIADDSFPFYVLFLDVPYDRVDVNVHPHKTEVRFTDEKFLYALVATSLRKALSQHQCMHTIDFTHSDTQAIFAAAPPATATTQPVDLSDHQPITEPTPLFVKTPAKSEANLTVPPPKRRVGTLVAPPVKLPLHGKYILTQVKSGLLVIDQYRAYERILYERYKASMHHSNGHSQQLLFAYRVTLPPADLALVKGCQHVLHQLGFRFQLEPDGFVVTGHPTDLLAGHSRSEDIITGLLEQYKVCRDIALPEPQRWAHALAKRNNLPPHTVLQTAESDRIVDALFTYDHHQYGLDGKPIWHIVPMERFEKLLEA